MRWFRAPTALEVLNDELKRLHRSDAQYTTATPAWIVKAFAKFHDILANKVTEERLNQIMLEESQHDKRVTHDRSSN